MRKKHFFMIMSFLASTMASCGIEAPSKVGDKCPPADRSDATLVYISEPSCTAESCDAGNFDYNFEIGFCPNEFPLCYPIGNDENTYYCGRERDVVTKCSQELDLTCEENGETVCISMNGEKTCGATSCDNEENYGGTDCTKFTDERSCKMNTVTQKYACLCKDGNVLCYDDELQDYKCITPDNDPNYCGAKGSCDSDDAESDNYKGDKCIAEENEVCSRGKCVYTQCTQTQCSIVDENGDTNCLNDATHCGSRCYNCINMLNDSAYCSDGDCLVARCYEKTHPVYIKENAEGKNIGNIASCEPNDITNCAPATMGYNDSPVDCTKLANVQDVSCSDSGLCVIESCATGYHLASDGKSCVENTVSLCAAPNSSTTVDCTGIENIASATDVSCNSSGACAVLKCKSGYHIGSDSASCVVNSLTSCGAVNSSNATNCSTIENIASTSDILCNSSGACVVAKCAANYHISNDKKKCVANSASSCGAVDSNSAANCTSISSIASSSDVSCNASGVCIVSKCKSGYHLASDKKSCVANTTSACGAVNGTSTTNCTGIANIASTSDVTCNSSGVCVVTKCKDGYHIGSDLKSCVENSASSCAPVNSSSAVNCTEKVGKVCSSSGTCVCSADGSTVLNYNETTCVPKACQGIPGVLAGETKTKNYYSNASEFACKAKKCDSGFTFKQRDGGVTGVCLPNNECDKYGYINKYGGSCIGCKSDGSHCGNNQCKTGYKYYAYACLDLDHCCGSRGSEMDNGTDHQCTNCAAQGKKCNTSTYKCQ